MTITRTADKASVSAAGTVAVADADTLTAHATTISGTAGQALSNVTVASFTDSDTANSPSDFAATITWGDGSTSAGTVSGGAGAFSVTGSHTYAGAGSDPVAVTLADDGGGASATANSTAQIGGGTAGRRNDNQHRGRGSDRYGGLGQPADDHQHRRCNVHRLERGWN